MTDVNTSGEVRAVVKVDVLIDNQAIPWTVHNVLVRQTPFAHSWASVTIAYDIESAESVGLIHYANFQDRLGKSLTIKIEPQEEYVPPEMIFEFVGTIQNVTFANDALTMNRVTFEAVSKTFEMDVARKTRVFLEQDHASVINALLGEYAVEHGSVPSDGLNTQFPYIMQFDETDWDFICEAARRVGIWVFYDGRKINIAKASGASPIDLIWVKNVSQFTAQLQVQPEEFYHESWDEARKEMISNQTSQLSTELTGLAAAPHSISRTLFGEKVSFSNFPRRGPQNYLRAVTQARKTSQVGKMAVCAGSSNVPAVNVGKAVKIKREGSDWGGTYFVTEITHIVADDGAYQNEFTAVPVDAAYPEWEGKPTTMPHVQVGLVIDNKDPEKRGRVKVKYAYENSPGTSQEGSPLESTWARLLSPYAGDGRGIYWVPEINDEVLVLFENGDPHYPIVIGSLWNGNDNPSDADCYSDSNDYKVFYTRSGHKLIFSDESGGEKISIIDKTGNNTIVIDSTENTITVVADKDIKLQAGGSIELKATQNIKLDAQNVEISAQQGYKVSAMQGEVSCNGTLDLKANGQATVDGGMINVNSKGPCSVSGMPIKLN